MSVKNYIFQTQNAVFKVLKNANLGLSVFMQKTEGASYPNIIILGTGKTKTTSGQLQLQTEIKVETQDFSPISASTILEKLEETLIIENLQEEIHFFPVQSCNVLKSSIFPTMEGFFHGMVLLETILD